MRKRLFLVFTLLLASVAAGRTEHIGALFEQVFYGRFCLGEGARAWGMGGGCLAVPGDASALSWNPAGVAGLKSASGTLSVGHDRLELSPGSGESLTDRFRETESRLVGGRIDLAAIAAPIKVLGRQLVLALSYRRRVPYGFDMTYAYRYHYQSFYRFDYDYQFAGEASGGLDTVVLSLAAEPLRGVRLGVNVLRWSNGFIWPGRETYAYSFEDFYGWDGEWHEDLSDRVTFRISGYSLDLGALISLRERYFFGLVLRTGASLALNYANAAEYSNSHTGEASSGAADGRGRLTLPASLGAGVALQASRNVLLSLDCIRTFWSRALVVDYVRAPSGGALPAAADFHFPSLTSPDVAFQRDSAHFHAGVEVTLRLGALSMPLRTGAFVDGHYAASARGTAVRSVGYTLGFGLRWRRMALDAAWVRGFPADRCAQDTLKASWTYGL